ncbi:hypothetical protein Goshw_016799, partial [Gossypium schwendimanii]|nr:hypothetical protein [Gossypium schwendimanii]
ATQLLPAQLETDSSPEDPPLVSPTVKLSDGRHIAYRERGVPKAKSNCKIIIVHGFGSSKDMNFQVPQELIEELGIYFLLYDRAGYGESDPNPKRSVKSEAFDIQELADQLQLGPKFYVIGVSMGSYPIWIIYLPVDYLRRLAGVAMVVPVINYRWPSFPDSLTREDYRRPLVKLLYWVAKYTPGLLHWSVTRKWFPSPSVMEEKPVFFNKRDMEALKKTEGFPMLTKERLRERSVFNTLRNDFLVCYGDWDFDPMELTSPFPQNQNCVHIWQGYEDKIVPFELQRCISKKLPWIQYHEVADGGHLLVHYNGLREAILRAMLLGEEHHLYRPSADKTVP